MAQRSMPHGKERAAPASIASADDETVQDTRWLNGVNRQMRPDAPSQRQAASQAAAVKRKAAAMPEAERKRRRADHAQMVRAQQKATREAAAAAAALERQVTLLQLNDLLEEAYLEEHPDDCNGFCGELSECDWNIFRAWVAEQPEADEFDIECCMEFYHAWRNEGSPDPNDAPSAMVAAPPAPPPPPLLPPPSPPPPSDGLHPTSQAIPLAEPATGVGSLEMPPPPAGGDGPPDDPWGGGSADMYYEGPADWECAEQRERSERERRGQPGFARLNLALRSCPCLVVAQLCVVKEDYNDGYELQQERWHNEDARRSAFYGVPAGDLPSSAAAPFGFVPPSGLPVAEPDSVPQPHRDDVDLYGPLANNPDGDRLFRRDRALWYESITGQPLTGTLTEQWEKADVLARSFRADNTRSGRP